MISDCRPALQKLLDGALQPHCFCLSPHPHPKTGFCGLPGFLSISSQGSWNSQEPQRKNPKILVLSRTTHILKVRKRGSERRRGGCRWQSWTLAGPGLGPLAWRDCGNSPGAGGVEWPRRAKWSRCSLSHTIRGTWIRREQIRNCANVEFYQFV